MEKTVYLPDGSEMTVPDDYTVEDIAYEIGTGLGDDCIAAYENDNLVGSEHIVQDNSELSIITEDSEDYIDVVRHTSAHIFAQALKRKYPDAKLAIGPPTEDGFYYDISDVNIDSEVLENIELEMQNIIEENLQIQRREVPRDEALERYSDNKYKKDILRNEASDDIVSFYEQGEFSDLCRGGHLSSTGKVGAVKLLEVSSAYWRGEEENEMLTRVYGTAFETEEQLEEYLDKQEKLEERSHRKIGRKMNLFQLPNHSPAPQYLPNGMIIRRELEEYMREINDGLGYREVWTPELNTTEIFKQSGHYDAFCEDDEMFYWEQGEKEYSLKPMNCGNHAKQYEDLVESYRDLPIRLSEFGTVYRYERSGSGTGLFRARGFTQDDGHAFVRQDQLQGEVKSTLESISEVFENFDLDVNYKVETKPANAVGSDEVWNESTDALMESLESLSLNYSVQEGEGAFYGPKIGADVEDVFGREWTLGTVQIDFNIPRRLGLSYVNRQNEESTPIMIHRAIIGSFERFIAILLEDTNGHLPPWLSPIQVRILPISEDVQEYAQDVSEKLSSGIDRVEVDDSDNTLKWKIRRSHEQRIPYSIIVGKDEQKNETIAVRDRQENEVKGVDVEDFVSYVRDEIETKRNDAGYVVERD